MNILNHIKENLITFFFSTVFGMLLTTAIAYVTATPTDTTQIIDNLKTQIVNSKTIQTTKDTKIDVEYIKNEVLGLGDKNSIILCGKLSNAQKQYRFVTIFEQDKQSLLDKVLSRSSFYTLTSQSEFPIDDSDSLLIQDVEIKDIDNDGFKEIFVDLYSQFADSTSKGYIILKKSDTHTWQFIGIPDFDELLASSLAPQPKDPQSQPIIFFSSIKNHTKIQTQKVSQSYKDYHVYEDGWDVIHNGNAGKFYTLRNGVLISQFRHPKKDYWQLGIVATIDDDSAVLGEHHIISAFLKLDNDKLVADPLWNWGYSMLSLDKEKLSEIKIGEFQQAGVNAHMASDLFYTGLSIERN